MDGGRTLAELERIDGVVGEGKLSKEGMAKLRETFGARFTAALRLVRRGCVKKYVFKPSGRVRWIVVGNEREYLIYDRAPYCHCDDFYLSVMNGSAKACKHLIAQRLASQLGLYEVEEESDEKYVRLLEEWRKVDALPRTKGPNVAGGRRSRWSGDEVHSPY